MKWVDYRETLGIGFDDHEKFGMLKNILTNYIRSVLCDKYNSAAYLNYCQMVGENYSLVHSPSYMISDSLHQSKTIKELLAKYIAMYNSFVPRYGVNPNASIDKMQILEELKDALKRLNISFEVIEDEDGSFVFPTGASEFDDALVSEILAWLKEYPKTRKMYIITLQQYGQGQYVRDVADNMRKTFEDFLREFFDNDNDLNKNKKEVESYLKGQGAAPQMISMIVSLISHYYLLNNDVAKHKDKMDPKYLEFLLYQTGLFIRMLITVKRDENSENIE